MWTETETWRKYIDRNLSYHEEASEEGERSQSDACRPGVGRAVALQYNGLFLLRIRARTARQPLTRGQ